jgi:hypothetical protein
MRSDAESMRELALFFFAVPSHRVTKPARLDNTKTLSTSEAKIASELTVRS